MGICRAVFLSVFFGCLARVQPLEADPIRLSPHDRLLVLAAHPDDDVLGAGGLLAEAMARGVPARVVYLTSGDRAAEPPPSRAEAWLGKVASWVGIETRAHNPGLFKGRRRMDEARRAAEILGVPSENLIFLGYPDSLTYRMWTEGWGEAPPTRSKYTQADRVPYQEARRAGTPYRPEEMVRDLEEILRAFRPTVVAVTHAADFNPDHRALYLAARVALWNARLAPAPALLPYLVHYPRWPVPEKASEWPEGFGKLSHWEWAVPPEAQTLKRRALLSHESQNLLADSALMSLVDATESFSDFPVIPWKAGRLVDVRDPSAQVKATAHEEKLTDEERAAYANIDWNSLSTEKDALSVIVIALPLKEGVSLVVTAQGYRLDTRFPDMPKIAVTCENTTCVVTDRGLPLAAGVKTETRPETVKITWQAQALGNPERLLLTAQTFYKGKISAALGARVIER